VTSTPSPATQTASATPSAAELKPALQQAIADFNKQQGAPPEAGDRFYADYVDLNGDGAQDAVVILDTPNWCGTGGCTLLVLQGQPDKTFRLVSKSTLVRPPVTVSNSKTNGWRDLSLKVSGGGMPSKTVALKFDGKKYPPNPSVLPALAANAPIKGTVLFPEGTEPQTMSKATTSANLKTYDDPVMAIAAKYPSNMTVDANCSGEGCGYFFKFTPQKNALDEAEVQIFLPAGAKTAAQAEVGLNDLIKSNGWTVASQTTSPQEWKYPWVKKVITFSTDKEMAGHILIGETNRQGVRVTLLYPAEMSGAFTPAAKTILDNLKFKPDKLPITTKG
jgi:putative lipoprotein